MGLTVVDGLHLSLSSLSCTVVDGFHLSLSSLSLMEVEGEVPDRLGSNPTPYPCCQQRYGQELANPSLVGQGSTPRVDGAGAICGGTPLPFPTPCDHRIRDWCTILHIRFCVDQLD